MTIPASFLDEIRARVPLREFIAKTVRLSKHGKEFKGLCPFHGEKSPSFTVYAKNFHCFGCGEHGDVIDFLQNTRSLDFLDAVASLAQFANLALPPSIAPKFTNGHAPKLPDEYENLSPVFSYPDFSDEIWTPLPIPPDAPSIGSGYKAVYEYRGADGSLIGYVTRREITTQDGKIKKIILPLNWGYLQNSEFPSGRTGWIKRHLPRPMPLYGLDILAQRPRDPVIICEGEKAADAARKLFPGYVGVSWPRGGQNVPHCDWRPLARRRVVIWPDNDPPDAKGRFAGLDTARAITEILQQFDCDVEILDITGLPEKFDAADLQSDDPELWLLDRLPRRDDDSGDLTGGDFEPPHNPGADFPDGDQPNDGVIPLGFDHDFFYYYSISKKQIKALTAAEHTSTHLVGLASLPKYWENLSLFRGKNGLLWPQIADDLMTRCREIGIFSPSRRRGRGAWLDGTRTVLHLGNTLLVDGQPCPLHLSNSHFIYEQGEAMLPTLRPPLSTADANWLFRVSKLLRWEIPAHATLFAGWIAIAPICGALRWRPSIWLTAASGAGKSFVLDKIISVCLGEIAQAAAGGSTEAGIRQKLRSDARPVILDEMESEDSVSTAILEGIFRLVRISSSENSPDILKGQASQGRALNYRMRSAFLFQSINVGLSKQADESRITVLSLRDKSNERDITYADLSVTVRERITPDFAAGLIARSVSLIPVIMANAEIFSDAIAAIHNSRRMGDQIGTLLAGAYSLHSSTIITPEAAKAFISRDEWQTSTPDAADKDEYRLLRYIMAARLRLGTSEIPVSRLLEDAQEAMKGDGRISPDTASRTLTEAGIRPGHHENVAGIFVSSNHPMLAAMLRATVWKASWARSLARLPGTAAGREIKTRFGLGHQSRAVFIPMAVIDPGE